MSQLPICNNDEVRPPQPDELAARIVVAAIEASTGPTGGWLDSPQAVCATIIKQLREAQQSCKDNPCTPDQQNGVETLDCGCKVKAGWRCPVHDAP